jgi:isopentenyl diphosphate isomerase/L-lactate dehydrogenase-like FMN-dependent dehydrogenase
MTESELTLPKAIREFEDLAAEKLPVGTYGFYAGGAGDEQTLNENLSAWRRIRIRPRVLVGVETRDLSTTVLGSKQPHPVIVAPMGFHYLAHPDAEVATARAAAMTDSVMCLSTFSTVDPATLAAQVPSSKRWFQVYVLRDRGVTRAVVENAEASGCEALVLTVDTPVLGRRERDLRTGFVVEAATAVPSVRAAGLREPMPNDGMSISELAQLLDPGLTWADVEQLVAGTALPVIVKGVLDPRDARHAVDHGAAGVVVSNHGGRQLDTVPPTAECLPAVVDEVGEDADVIVDGGIRRGTDVFKALAIGARAVMVGRPVLWGLAVGGAQGASRVLELLITELDNTLALAGAPSIKELESSALDLSLLTHSRENTER